MSTIRLTAATATDPGRVRAVNEDKALADDDLVAVADGMGGHVGGEVAAVTAVEALRSAFGRERSTDALLRAVEHANRAVYERSVHDRSLRGMGTTLTAAAVVHQRGGDKVVLVNVGDSRAYLLDGAGLSQLTEDHSLVEEMVRRGELTPAEAAVHPHRHIVTRVLGIDESIDVDAWELDPKPGWRLLLCSDGLTNELGDDELEAVLAERRSSGETARELVERALAHGGNDNVTVVVVDFGDETVGSDDLRPSGAVLGATGDGDAGAGAGAGAGPAATTPDTGGRDSRPVRAAGAGGGGAGGGGGGGEQLTEALSTVTLAGSLATAAGTAGGGKGGGPMAANPPASTRAAPTAGAAGPRGERGRAPRRSAAPAPVLPPPEPTRRAPVRVLVPAGPLGAAPAVVRIRHERIMSVRVFLFLLVLVAVLGGAVGFVVWFVKASYFVGVSNRHVVIYQGRPGGLLWFRPAVVERSDLALARVFPPTRPYLEAGMQEPSLAAARQVLALLGDGSSYLALPAGDTGHANGIPVGSTLVPISSPVLTVPPAPVTSAPATTPAPPTTTIKPIPPVTRAVKSKIVAAHAARPGGR